MDRRSCTLMLLVALVMTVNHVAGFPTFQSEIPNGIHVPDPCNADELWPGVGHINKGGAGLRNPFGADFESRGKKWTVEFCRMDSDGDGKINGVELGDPNCTWTKEGSVPPLTTGISHPGVCEPMNMEVCRTRNTWLNCPEILHCPAFSKSTTTNVSFTIPYLKIPPKDTTLICLGFKIPISTRMHSIGYAPNINNTLMVHHMVVAGCDGPIDDVYMKEAFECDKFVPAGCHTVIARGRYGYCAPDEFGFNVGPTGYEYLVLQVHWNNPLLLDDQYDGSGWIMALSSEIRPNDASFMTIGGLYINIPPRTNNFNVTGRCSEECTSLTPGLPVKVPRAIIHMHLMGRDAKVYFTKRGREPQLIMNVTNYDFDNALEVDYDPPLTFEAGDAVEITCTYSSMNKNVTTTHGDSTNDEMCFVWFIIYPTIPLFGSCSSWKDVKRCSVQPALAYKDVCDVDTFDRLVTSIGDVCNMNTCETSADCHQLLEQLRCTGCTSGTIWEYAQEYHPHRASFDLIKRCSEYLKDGNQRCASGGMTVVGRAGSSVSVIFAVALFSLLESVS